jgi:hypothetical protein
MKIAVIQLFSVYSQISERFVETADSCEQQNLAVKISKHSVLKKELFLSHRFRNFIAAITKS